MNHYYKKTTRARRLALSALALLSGCAFQTYSPKPLDPTLTAEHLQARDPSQPAFRQYLLSQGYSETQLPIRQWDLRDLTFSAFYFHPQLEVARAKWRATQAKEITAGSRPNPGISGLVEHHSQDGNSPWLYGIAFDIPVVTGDKRQARIEEATNLSNAARMEIGQTAWDIRKRLREDWLSYNESRQRAAVLRDETALRKEIVDMLEARLSAGMVSNVELGNARLLWQEAQQALLAEEGRLPGLEAALASSAGLSVKSFRQLALKPLADLSTTALPPPEQQLKPELQQAAMLNRLDIRAALARYAAAEAKLRLEIARQYPDIVLSPGYSYDQGDRIWSLGFSTLLALVDRNQGLIAEAKSLREVEAAQFEALQANVIAELDQAEARYSAAVDEWKKARELLDAQQSQAARISRQFDRGYADRLEYRTAQLSTVLARQGLASAYYKVQRSVGALEDAVQRPLEDGDSILLENLETKNGPSPSGAANEP
ncbi:MAG TPA: TolC family protein [Methylophilaceae bacterium]|nr:TolC family protein [Methylophilaceae bacterium]